jgi:tetratricopeptide (TPR) repeat protein
MRAGNFKESIEQFQAAIELDLPNSNSHWRFRLAEALEKSGQLERATTELAEAYIVRGEPDIAAKFKRQYPVSGYHESRRRSKARPPAERTTEAGGQTCEGRLHFTHCIHKYLCWIAEPRRDIALARGGLPAALPCCIGVAGRAVRLHFVTIHISTASIKAFLSITSGLSQSNHY